MILNNNNAFHQKNIHLFIIVIPMAILNPPLFNLNFPEVINFAVLGFFIGHELTHGFDQEGCNYDMNGDEIANWCSAQAKDDFGKMAKCFEQQYGSLVESRTGKNVIRFHEREKK